MKSVAIGETNLEACVRQAQRERLVLTKQGKPVAILLGVQGLDLEQLELCYSDEFWSLLRDRRSQRTIDRAELEKRVAQK